MPETDLTARAIGVVSAVASALERAFDWLADRLEDAAKWAANWVRYLPSRMGRIVITLALAVAALITFLPGGVRAWRRGGRRDLGPWLRARVRQGTLRVVQFVLETGDLVGLPELFAFVWRGFTRAAPLTGAEIAAAGAVMGAHALRYHDIRVAQGGILGPIFKRNGDRAFVTFHTVNMSTRGAHRRENLEILLHELVHVLQYERAGSRYFAEALMAQHEEGYGYGGPAGLEAARSRGKRLRDFNREQQAQIAQDYYMHLRHNWDTAAFEPYIAELRAGQI